jgi:cytochrome c nitrite reductase small subunit
LQSLAGVILGVLAGLAAGLGGFVFVYARGTSYLTNDPRACANCHVMEDHYRGWQASSHHGVAVCNDCHTPPGVVAKYAVKAENGFWHSFAFTTGKFPEPIQARPKSRAVTERACRKCHAKLVDAIDRSCGGHTGDVACVRCHSSVGHLR